uniref:Phospholipid/glycerol acyltransferase domain-containing protein n=1 Tax=Panagrolaimus sp. PS1159 TaxID=55785 RepID=A0AC35G1B1_9BILA
MSDTDSRSTPSSPNTLRQRNPLRSESSKKALKKLPGSRSKWSTLHSWSDKLQWFLLTPIRFVLCISNVTLFLFAYLGFMLPMLWAQSLWPRLYWGYEGKLYRWLQAFIGYWGYTAGYDIYEYGDDIAQYCDSDRVLVMVNHQSTADVPCLFAILQHKGVASRKTIWLMDQMFRWTPFGIIGQMHGDYFIKQGKATRDTELDRLKEHLRNVFWERDRRWVVLFPEGGFYYKRIEQSQAYGKKNGFPHLEHVTLPRMGAVKAILEEVGPREDDDGEMVKTKSGSKIEILKDTIGAIREKKYVKETRPPIKYVLDITIAYPNGQPLSLWTLCFGTREKCDIAVHYKIFKADEVPFDDEIKLRDWMYSVYEHKDQLLDNFYQFGKFDRHDTGDRIIFPWSKIVLQYLFWITSFVAQIKLYHFLLTQFYHFLFPSY